MSIMGQNAILNQFSPKFVLKTPLAGQVLVWDAVLNGFTNKSVTGVGIDIDAPVNPAPSTGIVSYTWAAKPRASVTAIGTEIDITDVGTPRSRWYTDGANWRPVNGSVIIYNANKSFATPVVTGSSAAGDVILPTGNPKIPAGMLLPGAKVVVTGLLRNAGSSGMGFSVWFGTSQTGYNGDQCVDASISGGFDFAVAFTLTVASSTTVAIQRNMSPGSVIFANGDSGSALIDTTLDMYLHLFADYSGTIFKLIGLTVSVQQ